MTRLNAKRKLHNLGQTGNWRFKGLLLASLPDTDVTPTEVAEAWPDPGKSSDYRFLSRRADLEPEKEQERRIVAEKSDPMNRLLSDYAADPQGAPKHLSDDPTKDLGNGVVGAHVDDAIPRMLFAADEYEEVDTLFRNFLDETIREGAQAAQMARDAATVTNVDTAKGDLPVAQDDTHAPPVAHGGEIRDDIEDYDTVEYQAKKYGQGARVTEELIETANIDKIEREIQFTGRAVENSLNRVFLTELVDSAISNGATVDAGAEDDRGYQSLNAAWTEVDKNDFTPDVYASHPEFRGVLFGTEQIAYANRAGGDEAIRNRTFDPILDLDMHAAMSGHTYDDGSDPQWPGGNNTWGYENADEVGSVVYNRDYVEIALKREIESKNYDDPIRDLRGVNARAEFDTVVTQARATAAIQY